MDLVYKEYGFFPLFFNTIDDSLEAFFKVTAILGACKQGAHVKEADLNAFKHGGDFLFMDVEGQTLGNGCFAHTRFAYQQRVVFAAPAEDLHDSFQLPVPAYEGIDQSRLGSLRKVDGIFVKIIFLGALFFLGLPAICF